MEYFKNISLEYFSHTLLDYLGIIPLEYLGNISLEYLKNIAYLKNIEYLGNITLEYLGNISLEYFKTIWLEYLGIFRNISMEYSIIITKSYSKGLIFSTFSKCRWNISLGYSKGNIPDYIWNNTWDLKWKKGDTK